MARKVRIFVEGLSQHILLKSIEGLMLFKDEEDYDYFKATLKESSLSYELPIHAYILMPTFFEFLSTPPQKDTLSRFIQSIARKYTAYYNSKYNHMGTLWQGRYKSSIVQNEKYLFDVMRYIEQLCSTKNIYNSIHKNLYNQKDTLVSYNSLYKELGYTDDQRVQKYATYLDAIENVEHNRFIQNCLEQQIPTASLGFIKKLEEKLDMVLLAKRGRPKKENTEKGKKMYKNLVILDKEKHKDLKINPLQDLNFAKNSHFIPVIATEAALVGATFPIVFTAEENSSLVSILALGGECLAINEEGKWITSYVPSFLRKYPFSLANTKENPEQKVILIDEDSNLFSKTKGEALFNEDKEKTQALDNAINYLTSHENQIVITKNVAKLISDSGILEDREISVGEGEEKKVLVNGFKVVDKEKLNALSDDILADWVRKGIINLIEAHLKSLENIQTLFDITQARQN
ncbi:MAG: SapC family protein [Arcobacteraceae bacterium]